MKTIVVSAVNLNTGGTLTILRECLTYLSGLAGTGNYRVVALVHKQELADYPGIEYIQMQWPKKSWIQRLWCEYVTMYAISKQLSPVYLWLSLHDTTPTVRAERRAVYCHNPFPFYQWSISECLLAPKIVLFALFSKYIYWRNIHRNTYVIVQQVWIKNEFIRLFKLEPKKIIVAKPSVTYEDILKHAEEHRHNGKYRFFFAAAPNTHKNFECICRAGKTLEKSIGKNKFEVCLTLKGDENAYARWLYFVWGRKVSSIRFVGYLDKKNLYSHYAACDCLIFPSKVETWGLPITEFAGLNKPMLLADLPYAHETAAGCREVSFFDPKSHAMLAAQMKSLVEGNVTLLKPVSENCVTQPVTESWDELFNRLL